MTDAYPAKVVKLRHDTYEFNIRVVTAGEGFVVDAGADLHVCNNVDEMAGMVSMVVEELVKKIAELRKERSQP